MIKIFAQQYIQLGGKIREAQHLLDASTGTPHKLSTEYGDMPAILVELKDLCGSLQLPVSSTLLADGPRQVIPATSGELGILVKAIIAELETLLFVFIPPHIAKYYERDDLVSDHVKSAFPSASAEIREAGTCLASGLNTACVFHAMRAAEIGVRCLGEALSITLPRPIEQSEWQAILNALVPKIQEIENLPNANNPNKPADLAFYTQAAAQFRFFKNGWRVHVAHARRTYNEPEAIEAIDHVRSFFETLAERLKE